MAQTKPSANSKKRAPLPPKRIDWLAAKLEYVTNAVLKLDDIAKKYDTTLATVLQRAHREAWTSARAERAQVVSQRVIEKATMDSVSELVRYNEQDLIAAKNMRALVGRQMAAAQTKPLPAKDLRALAGAMESAQRVARLALGASTTNADNRNTNIEQIERMTSEERMQHAVKLYQQLKTDDETGVTQ